jgi:hypothetical protein
MKKLLFGLMATVFLSVGAFGQTLGDAGKRSIVNSQMTLIVNASKAFYVKGQSYDDFVKNLSIPSPTVPTQDEFFRKVYTYVSSGTADCDIMKADNSILTKFATDLVKSPRNVSTPGDTYSAKKRWWQILINAAINISLDLLEIKHEAVDLFPDA